jgi:thiamine pyrophosphokinase
MKNNLVLIANGRAINPEVFHRYKPEPCLIMAIDGGANQCENLQIIPDYIVGDFDSITPSVKEKYPNANIMYRPSQDLTDMEKALAIINDLNPRKITIFSAFGNRMDHTAGNLLIFQNLEINIPLEIIDNYGLLRILHPGINRISGIPGKIVSLFSFRPVKNLIIEGFKYTIKAEVYRDSFIGMSNIYQSESCAIQFDAGTVFIYEVMENE